MADYSLYVRCKVYFDNLNRLGLNYECDRQTDRQTDKGRMDGRQTDILIANDTFNCVARPKIYD